jgi:hypothetical protein
MGPNDKPRFCARTHLQHPLTGEYQHYRIPLQDLSLTGAFIEDDLPLSVGQTFPLTIWFDENSSIDVEAVVRRAARGHGVGVEFVGMTPPDSARLREFLAAAKAKTA